MTNARISALAGLFLISLLSPFAQAELNDGVTLYASFNSSARPDVQAGPSAKAPAAKFVEGKVGQAVEVGSEGLSLQVGGGSFNRTRGTLAFWIRPDWDGNAIIGNKAVRYIFDVEHMRLCHYPEDKATYFMTMALRNEKYEWDYSSRVRSIMDWKAGEWHHLVLTWDSQTGAKQIFVNGRLETESTTELLRKEPLPADAKLLIGGRHGAAAFDELAAWNRVLTADEVNLLFEKPEEASRSIAGSSAPSKQQ